MGFPEAHERDFRILMCFKLLRYDNLKSIVKRVLRGYQQEENSRFTAFRSHWRFQSEFCNPVRGNEKARADTSVADQRRILDGRAGSTADSCALMLFTFSALY
jgi:transposase